MHIELTKNFNDAFEQKREVARAHGITDTDRIYNLVAGVAKNNTTKLEQKAKELGVILGGGKKKRKPRKKSKTRSKSKTKRKKSPKKSPKRKSGGKPRKKSPKRKPRKKSPKRKPRKK